MKNMERNSESGSGFMIASDVDEDESISILDRSITSTGSGFCNGVWFGSTVSATSGSVYIWSGEPPIRRKHTTRSKPIGNLNASLYAVDD